MRTYVFGGSSAWFVKTSNISSVFGRLSLSVVEVDWDGVGGMFGE